MLVSAKYVCPLKGLAELETPELGRLRLAAELEPKEHVEVFIQQLTAATPNKDCFGYIEISKDDYSSDPAMHFPRLWDHFREWVS